MAVDIGTLSGKIVLDDQFTKGLGLVGAKLDQTARKFQTAGASMSQAGGNLTTAVTLPLALLGGVAIKAASDFESSFAGVIKTVDATEAELAVLSQGFRDLAKEIPVSVNELNAIGEAAGQLGIKTENILTFTKTMAELGIATNLSADQAATALARLANITGLPQTEFDRLGSTIVALGNNLATTESEILDFGLRIAGAGEIAGLTEAQILAIGGAMSSVGIEAAAGGTAVQKVLLGMTEAVSTGGEKLEAFANAAGMSADQFATAFKTDAAGAFTAFVEGLGTSGDQAFGILSDLGLEDERLKRAFLSLAGAGGLLADAVDLGTKAYAENAALAEEVRKRYETFASQLTVLKNNAQDVFITLGTALLPILQDLVKWLTPIIQKVGEAATWFSTLPAPVRAAALAIAAIAAAIGPVLVVAGSLITAVGSIAGAVGGIAMFMAPAIAAIGAGGFLGGLSAVVTGILGPVGAVIAVGALSTAIGGYVNEQLIGTQALADFGVWLGFGEEAVTLTAAELETMANRTAEVADAAGIAAPALADVVNVVDEAGEAAARAAASQEELATALSNLGVVTATQANSALAELALALESGQVPARVAAQLIDDLYLELQEVGRLTPEVEQKLFDLANAHDRLGLSATSAIAGISALGRSLYDSTIQFQDNTAAVVEWADIAIPKMAPPLDRGKLALNRLGIEMVDVDGKIRTLGDAMASGQVPVRQMVTEIRAQRDEFERLGLLTPDVAKKMGDLERAALDGATAADKSALGYKGLFDGLQQAFPALDGVLGRFSGLLGIFGKITGALGGLGGAFGDFFGKIAGGMGGLLGGGGGGGGGGLDLGGLFGSIKGMFGGGQGESVISAAASDFGALLSGGMSAAAGPAVGGFMGTLTGLAGKALNFLPVIGPLLATFAGPLFEGLKAIGSKIFGFVKGLFGGPDKAELEARDIGNSLNEVFNGMLDAQQKAEAGGQQWAASNIAIRDSYLAAGFSADEAAAAATRLAESVRKTPEEAQAAADAVKAVTDSVAAAMASTGMTLTQLRDLAINKASEMGISVAAAFAAIADGTISTMQAATDATLEMAGATGDGLIGVSTLFERRVAALTEIIQAQGLDGEMTAERIAEATERIAARISERTGKSVEEIKAAWSTTGAEISSVMRATGDDVGNIVRATGDDIGNIMRATGDDISTTMRATGDDVTGIMSATGDGVVNIMRATGDGVRIALEGTTGDIESAFSATLSIGQSAAREMGGAWRETFDDITDAAQEMADELVFNSIIPDMVAAANTEILSMGAAGGDAATRVTKEFADVDLAAGIKTKEISATGPTKPLLDFGSSSRATGNTTEIGELVRREGGRGGDGGGDQVVKLVVDGQVLATTMIKNTPRAMGNKGLRRI